MLSKNKMVKSARKSIEMLYDGTCNVTISEKYTKPNGATVYRDIIQYENEPCRLSYSSSPSATTTDANANVSQSIKLFVKPELQIKAGSKIEVSQAGITKQFISAGIPTMYFTHQEINLESEDKYA